MKTIYYHFAQQCSKMMTQAYTNSFSQSIKFFPKKYQQPIYGIYGFLRLGDEIVDTFYNEQAKKLLSEFKEDTYMAIKNKMSLNPILYHFQQVVNEYQIDNTLIEAFFDSMAMDLTQGTHTQYSFKKYIFGVSEIVGLMCLKIFCKNNTVQYDLLKPYAMKLGSTLQKVNFLRDIGEDYYQRKRFYFPNIKFKDFNDSVKRKIEETIKLDFKEALKGIKMLPPQIQFGTYLAYSYYKKLFKKIKKITAKEILQQRLHIPNYQKYVIVIYIYIRYKLNFFF